MPNTPLEAMKSISLLIAIFSASLSVLAACQSNPSDRKPVEEGLRTIASGGGSLPDLFVTYSDMHGLWGGVTISVRGNGTYESTQRRAGAGAAEVVRGATDPRLVRQLASLLVELRAWEQHTSERAPVPDESRATLTVRVANEEVPIWEWYNDLEKNARLGRIRDRMVAMGEQVRLDAAPN